MANSITFFTNDSGAAGGAIDFVKDALADISLTATNNTGLSSTISSNPLNDLFGNDDSPRLGAKTLFIKDLVLVEERYKWVNGKPTYRIIWNENFPQVSGYVFGDVQIKRNGQQLYVLMRSATDGVGVTGIIRRASFIVNQDASTTATGTIQTDGVAGATVDYSTLASPAETLSKVNRLSSFVHAAANETQELHDIRLVANQADTLRVVGVTVYYENSGANLEFRPGTTYNNKNRSSTTAGASLAIPTLGSTLGGRVLVYKTAAGTYAESSVAATMIASTAAGAGAGTTIDVTAGHGASFPAGVGVIAASGTSMYVGIVNSVSTDTLTVQPPLGVAVAGPIYRSFVSGQSLAINASLHILAYTFGSTEMQATGMTSIFLDPRGRFCVWGANVGQTLMNSSVPAIASAGASGFLQVDGYFSAAEVEWFGMSFAVLSGTMSINGLPAYSHANIGMTGTMKKTVFMDAGPGWNSFRFSPGSSFVNVGVSRVNLYRRNHDIGQTFGQLAAFDVTQAFTDRAVSATYVAPGTYQRVYADQLPFKGISAWIRGVTTSEAGGVQYLGVTSTGSLRFEYFGKNFAVHGFAASLFMTIDGVSTSPVFNVIKSVASEGFHTVGITMLGPSTAIAAIDVFRSLGEMQSLQRFDADARVEPPKPQRHEVTVHTSTTRGSASTAIRRYNVITSNVGDAITYTDSPTLGGLFVINEPGEYAISTYVGDTNASGSCWAGISRNSSELTTQVKDMAVTADRLNFSGYSGTSDDLVASCSWTGFLAAGTIIRSHSVALDPTVAAKAGFSITQVRSYK